MTFDKFGKHWKLAEKLTSNDGQLNLNKMMPMGFCYQTEAQDGTLDVSFNGINWEQFSGALISAASYGPAVTLDNSTRFFWVDSAGVLQQGAALPSAVSDEVFPLAKVIALAGVVTEIHQLTGNRRVPQTPATPLPNTATQIEMETGTEAALRMMSPLLVAQAIAALAASAVQPFKMTGEINGNGNASTSVLTGTGTLSDATIQTNVAVSTANGFAGLGRRLTTLTSTESIGLQGHTTKYLRTNQNLKQVWKMSKNSTDSDIRFFIGWTSQTDKALMTSDDSPLGEYAGFQFSDAGGNANFRFIRRDGTTQTTIDTGIAVGSGVFFLEIESSDGGDTLRAAIYHGSTQVKLWEETYTTLLPTKTTALNWMFALRNGNSVSKQLIWYLVQLEIKGS